MKVNKKGKPRGSNKGKPVKKKVGVGKKPPKPKPLKPHIQVHYPPGKEHLYPKSHPKYKPKKK
jgi:hypothetical protein